VIEESTLARTRRGVKEVVFGVRWSRATIEVGVDVVVSTVAHAKST
jgi:hypothetical protein